MATLNIIKGYRQGQRLPLPAGTTVLGRSRECQVVIPQTSVSRQHARIISVQGRFYIEDMQSRNGTKVNDALISERTVLKDRDHIQICEFLAAFHADEQAPVDQVPSSDLEGIADHDTSTTVRLRLDFKPDFILQIRDPDKLRKLFVLGRSLSAILELDLLLPVVAERVLELFPPADRCLVLIREEVSQNLSFGAIKTRKQQAESLRYSTTIVNRCLESMQGFLTEDALRDMPEAASVIGCQIRSAMCVPLCNLAGEPYGVLQVDVQDHARRFTADDLELLLGAACQVIMALDTARRHEDLIVHEQKELGLEFAGQVQRKHLPAQLPQVPGYQFFAYYASAMQVGGDYYDFIPLPPHRMAITVGDVAGKGLPAALLATKLCSDTRNYLVAETDPAVAIGRLNDFASQYMHRTDRFVTLITAILDPATHAVSLVNAGHMAPLLYRRATGAVTEAISYEVGGQPLGLDKGIAYRQGIVELQPGDSLVLFTDGVTDAVNFSAKRFGAEGVLNAISSGGPFTPTTLGERLIKALERHSSGCGQPDDITLVVFGRQF